MNQGRLLICITIDNGSTNTVVGSFYSAHQAVSRFGEHNIDFVSYFHRKRQSFAKKVTDSKFSNGALVRMTPKSTSINWVTICLEQLEFWLRMCK